MWSPETEKQMKLWIAMPMYYNIMLVESSKNCLAIIKVYLYPKLSFGLDRAGNV